MKVNSNLSLFHCINIEIGRLRQWRLSAITRRGLAHSSTHSNCFIIDSEDNTFKWESLITSWLAYLWQCIWEEKEEITVFEVWVTSCLWWLNVSRLSALLYLLYLWTVATATHVTLFQMGTFVLQPLKVSSTVTELILDHIDNNVCTGSIIQGQLFQEIVAVQQLVSRGRAFCFPFLTRKDNIL